MADKRLPDYPAHASAIQMVTVDHTGPASYVNPGGEVLGTANVMTGVTLQGLAAIDQVLVAPMSVSGNFYVVPQVLGTGSRKTFKLLWFAVTLPAGVLTLTQVANAVNLSGETVRVTYMG